MTRSYTGIGLLGMALALLAGFPARAAELAGLRPVVGRMMETRTVADDTLIDVAFRARLGFDPVIRLNPEVPVWIPEPGTRVLLPTEAILPNAPEQGLVINVPEMRLYDYTVGPEPEILSIAIGGPEDPTLLGSYRIGRKRAQPTWYPPASIRAERPGLPGAVAPGPENPLGTRWMTVGATTYGIHGTNNRWSIGQTATHGCIRLYEDVMEKLYDRAPEGTLVTLVYEPIKLGLRDGRIYVEAHPDVYGKLGDADLASHTLARLMALGLGASVDRDAVIEAVRAQIGVPVAVGRLVHGARPPADAIPAGLPSEYVPIPR